MEPDASRRMHKLRSGRGILVRLECSPTARKVSGSCPAWGPCCAPAGSAKGSRATAAEIVGLSSCELGKSADLQGPRAGRF